MDKLLLAHRSFPGQFRWMLPKLIQLGIEVVFFCIEKTEWPTQGVKVIEIKPTKLDKNISDIGYEFVNESLIAGARLLEEGWIPDCIISHYGWGIWKISEVFEKTKLIIYCEWWYNNTNRNYHRWRSDELSFDERLAEGLNNASFRASINRADIAITPSEWQKSMFPNDIKSKLQVIEDGFPLNYFKLKKEDPLNKNKLNILYISRGFEVTRGIDIISKIEKLLNDKISLRIIADKRRVYDNKEQWETEHQICWKKLNKNPQISIHKGMSYNDYLHLTRRTDLHLYTSRPFVLSWSFIESSLIGSTIFSLSNPSTIENTHAQHTNFLNLEHLEQSIEKLSRRESLEALREKKAIWMQSEELNEYRRKHSLETQITKLLALTF